MEEERQSLHSPGDPKREETVQARSASPTKTGPSGFLGRHRMAAAITHLQNEINLIQEELSQLEKSGESSIACREILSSVESVPDPLLPLTKGPANVAWDRWFTGTSTGWKRWI